MILEKLKMMELFPIEIHNLIDKDLKIQFLKVSLSNRNLNPKNRVRKEGQ